MLGSYRNLFVALAGLVLCGTAPPQEQAVAAEATQQIEPTTSPTPDYSAYPDKYADACYEAEDHDSADLCAQWRAAIAAEKGAEATRWGNLIGGIGAALSFVSIGLIVWTLVITLKQLTIAKADSEAARKEGANLARDTASSLAQATRGAQAAQTAADAAWAAVGSERAWLGSHIAAMTGTGNRDERGPIDLVLVMQWLNGGRSPAILHRVGREFSIQPYETFKPPSFDMGKTPIVAGVVQVGDGVSLPYITLSIEESRQFRSQKTVIYLYAFVEYFDVFSEQIRTNLRISEVCFRAQHLGGEKIVDGQRLEAIDYVNVGIQNRMT